MISYVKDCQVLFTWLAKWVRKKSRAFRLVLEVFLRAVWMAEYKQPALVDPSIDRPIGRSIAPSTIQSMDVSIRQLLVTWPDNARTAPRFSCHMLDKLFEPLWWARAPDKESQRVAETHSACKGRQAPEENVCVCTCTRTTNVIDCTNMRAQCGPHAWVMRVGNLPWTPDRRHRPKALTIYIYIIYIYIHIYREIF